MVREAGLEPARPEWALEPEDNIFEIVSGWGRDKEIISEKGNSIDYLRAGYTIVDHNNLNSTETDPFYSDIENRSKELLLATDILDVSWCKGYHRAMTGMKRFAKSYITSEYLSDQYNGNNIFDYTAIITGYLKSVEQLMYEIISQYIGKLCQFSNRDNRQKKYKKVLSKETLQLMSFEPNRAPDRARCPASYL